MKRILHSALAVVLALLLGGLSLGGCSNSDYEGPPEGWKVHLVRKLPFLLPEDWTAEDVGYGGSYYHPPDGGMLMVMPAEWGMSDLSKEE